MTGDSSEDAAAEPRLRVLPAISVVVCAYSHERWGALGSAVDSIERQLYSGDEIVVVIDDSPSLLDRARASFDGVEVVANQHAPGLSGARNTGVRHSSGDVIAFVDDDATADDGWLEAVRAAFSESNVVGVGGAAVPKWDTGRPSWFPEEFLWVVGCSYRGLPRGIAPIRNPVGANMAFRRLAFTLVGGFDEGIGRVGSIPLGCEETEFAIRVRQRRGGAVILFVPDARVTHLVTAARATWRYFCSRCWSEGLSKALVTKRIGAGDGLESERSYVTRVLPVAILRAFGAALRGDSWALPRAAAIAAGVVVTGAGYAWGTAIARRRD